MQIYLTKTVESKMIREYEFFEFVMDSLEKFKNKDWGNTTGEDAELNDREPDDALAAYTFEGIEIWIKADGPEVVTVLFPDED